MPTSGADCHSPPVLPCEGRVGLWNSGIMELWNSGIDIPHPTSHLTLPSSPFPIPQPLRSSSNKVVSQSDERLNLQGVRRAGPCGCFAVRATRSPNPTPSARAHPATEHGMVGELFTKSQNSRIFVSGVARFVSRGLPKTEGWNGAAELVESTPKSGIYRQRNF